MIDTAIHHRCKTMGPRSCSVLNQLGDNLCSFMTTSISQDMLSIEYPRFSGPAFRLRLSVPKNATIPTRRRRTQGILQAAFAYEAEFLFCT